MLYVFPSGPAINIEPQPDDIPLPNDRYSDIPTSCKIFDKMINIKKISRVTISFDIVQLILETDLKCKSFAHNNFGTYLHVINFANLHFIFNVITRVIHCCERPCNKYCIYPANAFHYRCNYTRWPWNYANIIFLLQFNGQYNARARTFVNLAKKKKKIRLLVGFAKKKESQSSEKRITVKGKKKRSLVNVNSSHMPSLHCMCLQVSLS